LQKVIKNKIIRDFVEYLIIYLFLAPFEYTIPKIFKNQSMYTLIGYNKKETTNHRR